MTTIAKKLTAAERREAEAAKQARERRVAAIMRELGRARETREWSPEIAYGGDETMWALSSMDTEATQAANEVASSARRISEDMLRIVETFEREGVDGLRYASSPMRSSNAVDFSMALEKATTLRKSAVMLARGLKIVLPGMESTTQRNRRLLLASATVEAINPETWRLTFNDGGVEVTNTHPTVEAACLALADAADTKHRKE